MRATELSMRETEPGPCCLGPQGSPHSCPYPQGRKPPHCPGLQNGHGVESKFSHVPLHKVTIFQGPPMPSTTSTTNTREPPSPWLVQNCAPWKVRTAESHSGCEVPRTPDPGWLSEAPGVLGSAKPALAAVDAGAGMELPPDPGMGCGLGHVQVLPADALRVGQASPGKAVGQWGSTNSAVLDTQASPSWGVGMIQGMLINFLFSLHGS